MATTDPHHTLVRHAALVHRALERMSERAIEVASRGTLGEEPLRAGVRDIVVAIRAHHLQEDEILLPELARKGVDGAWARVREDHERLATALIDVERASTAELADRLRALDKLLRDHITHEESLLDEAGWRSILSADEARTLGKALSAHAREHLVPAARQLPLMLYNLDEAEREEFTAPMPGFVSRGLVPFAFRMAWRPLRPFFTYPPPRILGRGQR